jgi:hypothetical protein
MEVHNDLPDFRRRMLASERRSGMIGSTSAVETRLGLVVLPPEHIQRTVVPSIIADQLWRCCIRAHLGVNGDVGFSSKRTSACRVSMSAMRELLMARSS